MDYLKVERFFRKNIRKGSEISHELTIQIRNARHTRFDDVDGQESLSRKICGHLQK